MSPKFVYQCQNWPSRWTWRYLLLCYLSKTFLDKYAPWWTDLSACAQLENIYYESNWSFIWNSKRLYAIKSQNDRTNNEIMEIPTQPQMTGFLSIFVHTQSLRLLLFLHLTKTKPLKSYEQCFLFHLNCSFGSCDTRKLGSWKRNNYDMTIWIAWITNFNFWENWKTCSN